MQKKVLIIGRHASMLNNITELLKQHGYNAVGKMTNEDAHPQTVLNDLKFAFSDTQ